MIPPITREEKYIYEIVGAGKTAPEKPLTRKEIFYAVILGEDRTVPRPITKEEKYLAALAGAYSEALPPPTTRIEKFLAKAAGMDVETPVPVTREEIFWDNYSAVQRLEGIPPIVFTSKGKTLKNYRIYGNTVEGESVGDKTDNLWNVEIVDNYSSYSNGKISPYVGRCTNIEPIVVDGNSYTLSYSSPLNATCIVMIKNSGELISRVFKSGSKIMIDTSGGNELYITWLISDAISITSDMIQDIMLNIGSTALPYEPYGYRVPVEINDYTATLYLPEPLKMVGDEAEYVDFEEQKQYFADEAYADVTLPELTTIAGTNILSVDTQIQPSKVYVEGEIKTV